jgi:hypothetical protein
VRLRRRRRKEEAPGWGVIGRLYHYSPDAPPRPPLREQIAVFSRPRVGPDYIPEEFLPTVRSIDETEVADDGSEESSVEAEPTWAERLPFVGRIFGRRVELDPEMKALLEDMSRKAMEDQGRHLVDEARLLLSVDDEDQAGLYAIPTTTGQVGVYLIKREPSGLSGGHVIGVLPDGIDWQIHYKLDPGGDRRWVAFGLLANDVEAVDLEFAELSVAAHMGTNAFFYEAEGQDPSDLVAYVLHLRDGSSKRLTTEPG